MAIIFQRSIAFDNYTGSGKQPGKALKWYQDVLNCLELLLMIIDGCKIIAPSSGQFFMTFLDAVLTLTSTVTSDHPIGVVVEVINENKNLV